MILDLKKNNLSGEIPPSLGQLQRLTTLLLRGNHFYGCLSCAMSNGQNYGLDNLTEIGLIDLSANSFGGPLPEFLLKLPLINKLNLSFNQFTGVLDGNVRASGHVNVFLVNNNISAVANLPNPFIDPKLGGNPVCQNQSFPLADICQYSGATLKAETWQQQTSCASICNQNSVAHPVTCKCSYPYICNMFFGWSSTYGLEGARIGHLRRELASELSVSAEDLWIDQAVYEDSRELKVFAKVLFYPAASIQQWDASQFTYIESQIVNKTIRLAGYDPYGIVSSNLLSTPLNSGSSVATKKTNHRSVAIIAGVVVGFVAMVTLSSLLVCFVKHKRKRPVPPSIDHASEIFDLNPDEYPSCLFTYDELKFSTRNFNRGNVIGEGAFGAVYKGTLRDCSEVAVKELPSNIKQGNQEFLNEVELICSLEHKNLVKLRGCAISGNNRLLVYEYVENKCLAQALFDPGTAILLEWPFRYNIALGLAKGLAFLHSRGPQRLAHGDIKANNVLLDNKLEPKIADFGLARMCQNNERKVLTRIEGKRGYVAPEFALHGQLTAKADVFSFGIIALELVSGRESMNSKLPEQEQYLLLWAWTLYEQRRVMELVDPKVRDGCDEEQALLLIKVALLCSQGDASSRPPMAKVVAFLSGDADVPGEFPERPAFLGLGVTDLNKPAPRPSSITTWK
ncbi:hypothetical protein KC19_2G208700 [Ceratodon purpureus]|uniref:Protein kinase domain-containing protein n=1 Tax=Ceratodon purpureus TaxID=3225 RepID=A0A8T0J054_CERPU|nr:hypothetical protein KC19_2G208700 [Ceratodon purpureus]